MRIFFFFLLFPFLGVALDASPRCLYDLEVHFFEAKTVKEALDLYRVYQNQWNPIVSDLERNVRQVPALVREKGRKLRPNPFERPFDPKVAVDVLLEAEYEVFRNTLMGRFFYDLNAIDGMFDYIRSKKMHEIEACLVKPYEKKKEEKPPELKSP